MTGSLIVAAAGAGKRVQHQRPKQLIQLKGRTILEHTLKKFASISWIKYICVGVSPEVNEYLQKSPVQTSIGAHQKFQTVRGGITRTGTIKKCLIEMLKKDWDIVLIHDAARPLVKPEDVEAIAHAALEKGICVPGAPVRDTLRKVSRDGISLGTLDRSQVWSIFTPQIFRRDIIENLLDHWPDESESTDDASIAEKAGLQVHVLRSSSWNIKFTFPEDLTYMEKLL